jgi:integrase
MMSAASKVRVHDPALQGRFLEDYLGVFGEEFRERRRHYALFKVLKLFVGFSGCESLDQAIVKYKQNNGEDLHVAVQKTINFLKERGKDGGPLAPKTVRYYVSLLKHFLDYHDVDTSRAWRKIKQPPKAEIRADRPIEVHEIQRLILATRSPRMRLLIQLLAQTGLRLKEALSLKVADIDFERGWIRVRAETTKNKRAREVPLIPELKDAILNYLKNRRVESPFLFPSETDPNKPMRQKYVYDNLFSLLGRLGLDARDPSGVGYQIHPHVFRKWFKTQLEAAGVNSLLVERWMGHKRGVEAVYFLPNGEMIREAVEEAAEALKIFGRPGSVEKEIEELRRKVEEFERQRIEDQLRQLLIHKRVLLTTLIAYEKKLLQLTPDKILEIDDDLRKTDALIDELKSKVGSQTFNDLWTKITPDETILKHVVKIIKRKRKEGNLGGSAAPAAK